MSWETYERIGKTVHRCGQETSSGWVWCSNASNSNNNGQILLQASADGFNLIKDQIGRKELQERHMQRSLVERTELYGAALTKSHYTRVLIELIHKSDLRLDWNISEGLNILFQEQSPTEIRNTDCQCPGHDLHELSRTYLEVLLLNDFTNQRTLLISIPET